ncbi:hypothetical protein N072000002_13640 [Clostridium tetani]|uniref:DUF1887 family protein n=1 Tax=Clostridium tetani TaxID=1513 RepID=A0ABC8EC62_CLOTA|nr:hypothetical protein [Clostridium tetani]BDR81184.1 hypothetical protein K234311028_14300 [Clostridium tetani]BDR89563.1 hypothetical protein N072000002_13640 [Clostridium tetani]
MTNEKVDNLVICSTLNQITNYLIIRKYRPKRIINITFDEEAKGIMNNSIKIEEWDRNLKNEISNMYDIYDNVEISREDMYSLIDIKDKIENEIINKIGNEEIYWHVTGGQRTIALAISELIKDKEREHDKILYIEGNTEVLVINNNKGELDKVLHAKENTKISVISDNKEELDSDEKGYGCSGLTFGKVLRLAGFNTKNLKSTKIFKEKTKEKIDENDEEYKFYKELYRILCVERESEISVKYGESNKNITDTFRNLLIKSNTIGKCAEERITFIRLVFEELLDKYGDLRECGYYKKDNINRKDEFNKSYPAGYIFEKITAYEIYDLIKDNSKILGMETSLKTYLEKEKSNSDKKENIIDELDIVLLTNTGKIINFECKSGGMKGDNAKSHNYTTYRLAGVFGMPILLSPLYENEIEDKDDNLKNQFQALNAAKSAELEVIPLDRIKEKLKKLTICE